MVGMILLRSLYRDLARYNKTDNVVCIYPFLTLSCHFVCIFVHLLIYLSILSVYFICSFYLSILSVYFICPFYLSILSVHFICPFYVYFICPFYVYFICPFYLSIFSYCRRTCKKILVGSWFTEMYFDLLLIQCYCLCLLDLVLNLFV